MMMQKFFFKRWKSFFLFMLIPIIILSSISTFFLYNGNKTSVAQEASNTLSIINDNFNTVLSASAYQYDLLTYNPQLILSLEKLLRGTTFEYTDLIFSNSIKASLSAVAQAHSYIDTIYLYLDGYDSFLSSGDGITHLTTAKDKDWHTNYLNASSDTIWIEKREYQEYTYAEPKKYLTMFQRMSNVKGVIVVNINIKEFENVLNNAGAEENYLVLLNQRNQFLCGNKNSSIFLEPGSDFFTKNLPDFSLKKVPYTSIWIKVGSTKYLVQSLYNEDYGITLTSLIPRQKIFLRFMPNIFIMFGAVISNCIISLLLAYYVTKRNFQQISHIIETFDEADKGNIPQRIEADANDEYDVILNNVISVFLNSSYLKHQLNEKQYKQELAELAALQLQINPHFLFNTLQTLDFEALSITGSPSTLNRMIQNLSDILKYSLGNPIHQVCLEDELSYLKKYADIQKLRLGEQFIIYYEIEEKLLDLTVFRLMLQPLIENSIQHGITDPDTPVYIKVRVYKRLEYVYFIVIDNGVGLSRKDIDFLNKRIFDETSENIGLTNINRRLLLKYGTDSALHILSKKNYGTCISFKIPYTEKEI